VTPSAQINQRTVARLSEFLHQQYPEIGDLELRELSEFGEGWETDLYRLRLMGVRKDKPIPLDLVLRLYGGNDPLEKAQKEYSLMTRVAQFGIATPRVDALVTDSSILGDPFIVMEYVPGGTLEASIQRDGITRWIEPMMETLARIHSIPWAEMIPEPQGVLPDPYKPLAYVEGLLREMELSIRRYRFSSFGPTMDWLHQRVALGAATTPTLIHNDYHPQNALLRDDELLVIDWSFAEVGDGRMDLAWTVMLLCVLAGKELRPTMLEAYERAAGTPVENFEYFEAIKFTMRMITIATWLEEDVEIPIPRITKQALRGDYRVHLLNPYRRLKEITGIEIRLIEEL
jgi:aminoglycoside phosphotransferase (APT) family kinase protein